MSLNPQKIHPDRCGYPIRLYLSNRIRIQIRVLIINNYPDREIIQIQIWARYVADSERIIRIRFQPYNSDVVGML